MSNKIKIVTSIYELYHEEARGGMIYKSFPLTSLTIRNLIFPDFKYVIYTDKNTYDKYDFANLFKQSNVEIKIQELNGELYIKNLNPIREKKVADGEIWERYYGVKNYVEVILNKFKHLVDESEDGYNTVWIDAGLFGTSCNDGWRDYMVEIAHTPNFINKINEKINQYGFICLRGLEIQINIDLKEKVKQFFGTDFFVVPGCLFGGSKENVLNVFEDYENKFKTFVETYNELISEQELLSVLTHTNKNVKFYNFDDWLDLQKGFLNIMDVFDKEKYLRDSCELYSTKYLHLYKRQ
jgi:hypothetical protein